MNNISIAEIAEKLLQGKEYRIFYHKRPDGDTVCSSYALMLALRQFGIKAAVIGSSPIPPIYHDILGNIDNDELISPENISVDVSSQERLGGYSHEKIKFCIDHHSPNKVDAEYCITEPETSSCGEVIYKIICAMGGEITKDIADLLFTALITDTFCFRMRNVNAGSFQAAADLAAKGADITGLAKLHFMTKSSGRAEIERRFAESFHYDLGGKFLGGIITLEDMEQSGITSAELEGMTSVTEQIDGVIFGVTVQELPDKRSRISVHTTDGTDASEICARLGGGGHYYAAGCEYDGSPEEALKVIKNICKEFI